MKTIRYEMIIYWSEEDHGFVVEVPELLVAWQMAQHIKEPSLTQKSSFKSGLKRRGN